MKAKQLHKKRKEIETLTQAVNDILPCASIKLHLEEGEEILRSLSSDCLKRPNATSLPALCFECAIPLLTLALRYVDMGGEACVSRLKEIRQLSYFFFTKSSKLLPNEKKQRLIEILIEAYEADLSDDSQQSEWNTYNNIRKTILVQIKLKAHYHNLMAHSVSGIEIKKEIVVLRMREQQVILNMMDMIGLNIKTFNREAIAIFSSADQKKQSRQLEMSMLLLESRLRCLDVLRALQKHADFIPFLSFTVVQACQTNILLSCLEDGEKKQNYQQKLAEVIDALSALQIFVGENLSNAEMATIAYPQSIIETLSFYQEFSDEVDFLPSNFYAVMMSQLVFLTHTLAKTRELEKTYYCLRLLALSWRKETRRYLEVPNLPYYQFYLRASDFLDGVESKPLSLKNVKELLQTTLRSAIQAIKSGDVAYKKVRRDFKACLAVANLFDFREAHPQYYLYFSEKYARTGELLLRFQNLHTSLYLAGSQDNSMLALLSNADEHYKGQSFTLSRRLFSTMQQAASFKSEVFQYFFHGNNPIGSVACESNPQESMALLMQPMIFENAVKLFRAYVAGLESHTLALHEQFATMLYLVRFFHSCDYHLFALKLANYMVCSLSKLLSAQAEPLSLEMVSFVKSLDNDINALMKSYADFFVKLKQLKHAYITMLDQAFLSITKLTSSLEHEILVLSARTSQVMLSVSNRPEYEFYDILPSLLFDATTPLPVLHTAKLFFYLNLDDLAATEIKENFKNSMDRCKPKEIMTLLPWLAWSAFIDISDLIYHHEFSDAEKEKRQLWQQLNRVELACDSQEDTASVADIRKDCEAFIAAIEQGCPFFRYHQHDTQVEPLADEALGPVLLACIDLAMKGDAYESACEYFSMFTVSAESTDADNAWKISPPVPAQTLARRVQKLLIQCEQSLLPETIEKIQHLFPFASAVMAQQDSVTNGFSVRQLKPFYSEYPLLSDTESESDEASESHSPREQSPEGSDANCSVS